MIHKAARNLLFLIAEDMAMTICFVATNMIRQHWKIVPLEKYDIPASKLVLELGYSIEYEEEKEDYDADENDMVELIDGSRIPWEQVKRDGIDDIALFYINKDRKQVQIFDAELA